MRKAKTKRKPVHWFFSDRPIESARADILGRSTFASGMAASIGTWDGEDSLVIALHGGWGTGKTSIKNMVLEKLRGSHTRRLGIVDFSPWQISGTGTLVGTFFRELGVALGIGKKSKAGLAERLTSYAKHLMFVGHVAKPVGAAAAMADPGVGVMIAAGGAALEQSARVMQSGAEASKSEHGSKVKSLNDLKKDLGTSLAALRRPILVVIDDIDRLTTDEILQVFKLVKANADLPNLVYLLLFERSIVEKALDQISGSRGHEFLQKIVQVDFHVPQVHRKTVEKVLFAKLEALLQNGGIESLLEGYRWRDLYADGISRYFQNLRHVYRFLGSFGFHVAQFKTGNSFEVNPVDLIGLEALRVFEPEVYERLPSAKRILTRDEGRVFFGRIKQEEVNRMIDQIIVGTPPVRQSAIRNVLEVLFPPISISFDNDRGVADNKQQWLRERRVCHADLFDKFFALVVAEGDLSQGDIDRLVSLTCDRKAFVDECQTFLKRGLLSVAIERLDAYREQIPLENMPALIPALCDLADEFPEPKLGPFDLDLCVYALRLVHCGMRREQDEIKRVAILREAFNETAGLALALRFVNSQERTMERTEAGGGSLFTESGLSELKSVCVAKIKMACGEEKFRNDPNLQYYLSLWFAWGDKNEVKAWVLQHIRSAKGAVWLLRKLMATTTSTGAGETTVHRYIHLRFLNQFFSVDRLEQLTSELKLDELTGEDKLALTEFRKALKRRAEGKPDHWEPGGSGQES